MHSLLLLGAVCGVLVSAGCIGSKTTQCSWGRFCPSDQYCEERLQRCLYTAQAEVCRGVDGGVNGELAECTFTDAPSGAYACQEGLCLRSLCGDGLIGPGEVCDDSNDVSGDGCSADCRSLETCGNAIVDAPAGESCDDGNFASYDGCSSGCTPEGVYYELLTSSLPERFGAAAAYDPLRQLIVVFSGFTSEPTVLTDTWEFDGMVWQRASELSMPLGRIDASLHYLPTRQSLVLFAGWSGAVTLDDMWEYDGTDWVAIQPPTRPPSRNAHAAAYDPVSGRLMIFGGETDNRVPLGDCWAFDGSDWSQVTGDATPSARRYAAMAYDVGRQRLVLFGGSREVTVWEFLNDTWEFDGTTWTQRTPTVSPSPRHGHSLDWDPVAERLVLFGGGDAGGMFGDTWEYDEGEWLQLTPATPPPPRGQGFMTLDRVQESLVVQSGNGGNYQMHQDAWALVGDEWVQVAAATPKARVATSMTFDSQRGLTVLFGGATTYDMDKFYDGTWRFSERVWTLVTTPSAPSGRAESPLVYDPQRGQVVLFGGCSGLGCQDVHGDTWIFDGTGWTELSPSPSPPPRGLHAMTYDATAGEVVLFGGLGMSGYRADTWMFDGTGWRSEILPDSPSPRTKPAMAFDPQRGTVVLFGGYSTSGEFLGDTWELDESGWHQVSPVMSPPGRIGHRMIYHAGRRRIQVLGGFSETNLYTDLWEYDGFTWSHVALPAGAPWRSDFGLVYDTREREVLLFGGGLTAEEPSAETWAYRYSSNWPDEDCAGLPDADEDGDGLVDCDDPDCDDRPCAPDQRCVAGECL